MQLIAQEFERKGDGGSLTLVAESTEDLWHVYNLVLKGDLVKATTIRKVTKETSMGSQSSERMRLTLEVQVEEVEYDPAGGQMRIRGKVLHPNSCCENCISVAVIAQLTRGVFLSESH
jgi:protein pelota